MKQERKSYVHKFFYALVHYGPVETFHLLLRFIVRTIWRFKLTSPKAQPRELPATDPSSPEGQTLLAEFTRTAPETTVPPAQGSLPGLILTGADTNFAGTRAVVLSHHDRLGLIEPSVRLLGRHFRALGYLVVLSSDQTLQPQNARPRWAEAVICQTGAEDEFCAWKIALHHFPTLLQCRELLLCNDHFFGPIGSFAPLHQRMEKQPCDFWGMSERRLPCPHVAPYYTVLSEKTLQNPAFAQFFERMTLSPTPEQRENRGVALTLWLQQHGLSAAVYLTHPEDLPPEQDVVSYRSHDALLLGLPLLHQSSFEAVNTRVSLPDWREFMYSLKYPYLAITRCLWRRGRDISNTYGTGKRYPSFPPNVFCLEERVCLNPAAPEVAENPSEELSVIVHCFYPAVLKEMAVNLAHLPRYATLYISTDTEAKKDDIEHILQPLGFKGLEVRLVPNKGWDIAPFLVGFRDVLEKPGIVLKVHAKGSLHKNDGHIWRSLIFDSLMGSPERVRQILEWFATHPGFGMLAPPSMPTLGVLEQGINHSNIKKLLRPCGVDLPRNAAIDFPVGSMFWCRTSVLRPWLNLNLSFDDFEDTATSPRDGTLGHAFERVFFFGCGLEGLSWGRVGPEHAEALADYFVDAASDGQARNTK